MKAIHTWITITLIVLNIGLVVCNGLLYSSLRKYRAIGAELTTNAKSAEHFFLEYKNLAEGQNTQFKNEHAMMCLGIAAHMGYDDAQARLANYLDNLTLQDGQYETMQLDWRKKAAAHGNPEHQYTYASSIGFPIQPWEKHLTQEQRETRIVRLSDAFELYRKAAEQGYHKAQSKLAQYYLNGYGCQKDLEEALRWAQKAYDFEKQQGDTSYVSAMYIGRIYLEMGHPDLALPYLEKGAIYGDPHATELWHKAHELQKRQKGETAKDKSAAVALTSCDNSAMHNRNFLDEYNTCMEEMLSCKSALATELSKVHDKTSADAAAPEVKRLSEQIESIAEQAAALSREMGRDNWARAEEEINEPNRKRGGDVHEEVLRRIFYLKNASYYGSKLLLRSLR